MSAVIEYVTEEVRRQGHDVTELDGIERVGWMLNAWSYALRIAEIDDSLLSLTHISLIGRNVEREKNRGGFRNCGVRVGTRICPPPSEVTPLLVKLLENPPNDFWGREIQNP